MLLLVGRRYEIIKLSFLESSKELEGEASGCKQEWGDGRREPKKGGKGENKEELVGAVFSQEKDVTATYEFFYDKMSPSPSSQKDEMYLMFLLPNDEYALFK